MIRFAAFFALTFVSAALTAAGPGTELDQSLKSIEDRYNRTQTLKLDFSETYVAAHKLSLTESGVLYLRKPGRMRWEYTSPAGKLFLADGKDTWAYTPENNRAERTSLKLSEDARAPLAFLLGRLDFHKDFQAFTARTDDAGNWITARPKSQNLSYAQVELQSDSEGAIHRLRIINQDQSRIEYVFSNEQRNVSVAPGLFVFHPAAGTQVVSPEAEK